MIEAKKKDLALFRLRRELRRAGWWRRDYAARRDELARDSGRLRANRESNVAVHCLQERKHLVNRDRIQVPMPQVISPQLDAR